MKKSLILILGAVLLAASPAYGWGRLGHATVAKIAEDYMTPKTKKLVNEYLHGKSIISYASYPDDYRSEHLIDLGFDATNCTRKTVWGHSFQALKDGSLYRSERKGNEYVKNCLLRIEPVIENLKANHRTMSDSARVVSLAVIVHIIGDLHCPKHIRYEDEPTSGQYPIFFGSREMSHHSYWDGHLLKTYHDWGYADVAKLVDRCTKSERQELSKGDIYTWAEENARDSRFTVERKAGFKVTRLIANEDIKHAERQIARAGYRLAAVLNDIFK